MSIPSVPPNQASQTWMQWFLGVRTTGNRAENQLVEDIGDNNHTVSIAGNVSIIENTPLTGTRTITLPANNTPGDRIFVVRTAASTGGSSLSVGGKKSLATGQWCILVFSKSLGWVEFAFGSL